MKSQNELFRQLSTLNNLPTLPHILLKLLDACNQESQDLNEIADMVGKDPALSAKILRLVNSAYFGLPRKVEAIGQAVVLVGTSGIKNMAICTCVYETFPKPHAKSTFNLKQFWWHSLRCASLAKHMAAAWEIGPPDEAFLAALLHDIGKAVLWVNFSKTYESLLKQANHDTHLLLAGEAHMGATHAEVGAWLLDRWHLGQSIADCVRYHHEDSGRMAQAFSMVQVVYVANLLCQDTESEIASGLESARHLFGCDPAECQTLKEKADQDAREVASSLDIDIDSPTTPVDTPHENDQAVRDRLTQEIRNLSLTLGTIEGFLCAEGQNDILKCMAEGLKILFDIGRCLFFLMDEQKQALVVHMPDLSGKYVKQPKIAVSMKMNASLLVSALMGHRFMDSFDTAAKQPLTIIDEQLIRLLGSKGILCLPLVDHQDPLGVVVVGLDKDDRVHLSANTNLLRVFLHRGASALRLDKLRRRELPLIQTTRIDASSDLARRVVHEVNNPLSVIKNYLKVLGMKMAKAGIDHDEIRIISDEITRVSRLLQKLTAFSKKTTPQKVSTDINILLTDLLKLLRDAMLTQTNIQVKADLEPDLPQVAADSDGLKQVFINLVKNAAEAMAEKGGNLRIQTRHLPAPFGGKTVSDEDTPRSHVEIVVADNGPGIPEAIKEKLFDPYVGTKSGDHSGLGLAVVYNLIKSFQGTITCESVVDQGTTFTIELPVKP